jgi:hypothetical protein
LKYLVGFVFSNKEFSVNFSQYFRTYHIFY